MAGVSSRTSTATACDRQPQRPRSHGALCRHRSRVSRRIIAKLRERCTVLSCPVCEGAERRRHRISVSDR